MTTHWRDSGPEGWRVPLLVEVPEECMADAGDTAEGPTAWLCTLQGTPDRARLPPELGGGELRVLSQGRAKVLCPCLDGGEKPTLELEDGYGVAHCPKCHQYLWFRRAKKAKPRLTKRQRELYELIKAHPRTWPEQADKELRHFWPRSITPLVEKGYIPKSSIWFNVMYYWNKEQREKAKKKEDGK